MVAFRGEHFIQLIFYVLILYIIFNIFIKYVLSNLCTTINLGTQKLWPLLTGGHCSEVGLYHKDLNWDFKMVVVAGRWSLFGGGGKLRFDCIKAIAEIRHFW